MKRMILLVGVLLAACSPATQRAPVVPAPTPGPVQPAPSPTPPTVTPAPAPAPAPRIACYVAKHRLANGDWRHYIAPLRECYGQYNRFELGVWSTWDHGDYTLIGYVDSTHVYLDYSEGDGTQYLYRDVTDPRQPGPLTPIQPD